MNRRTTLMLSGMALLGLAALPQVGFAQSNPLIGTWKLNLAKSKYGPGSPPPPRSTTFTYQAEGENVRNTVESIDAEGKPQKAVVMHIYDGKPYPSTGTTYLGWDASAYTRVDAYTVNFSRLNAGKVVQTGSIVVSRDGKTLTLTTGGTGPNGRQINDVSVYDK